MRGAALLVAAALAACSSGDAFRPLAEGDPAPEYAVATLEGDTLTLAGLQGKAVLVNVWATWCPPCREEMPALDRLARETEDLVVLAVSIDTRGDRDRVREFMTAHGPAVTVGHDPARRVERAFRTVGVPESFLIDREGRIEARWIGAFDPLSEAARAEVAQALATR